MNITISLRGLRMKAFHGVAPSERKIGNDFSIDISVVCDASQALEQDKLSGTVSYADLAMIAKREMLKPSYLLENVVWRIRESILEAFPSVVSGNIRLTKLLPPVPGIQLEGADVEIAW